MQPDDEDALVRAFRAEYRRMGGELLTEESAEEILDRLDYRSAHTEAQAAAIARELALEETEADGYA